MCASVRVRVYIILYTNAGADSGRSKTSSINSASAATAAEYTAVAAGYDEERKTLLYTDIILHTDTRGELLLLLLLLLYE